MSDARVVANFFFAFVIHNGSTVEYKAIGWDFCVQF